MRIWIIFITDTSLNQVHSTHEVHFRPWTIGGHSAAILKLGLAYAHIKKYHDPLKPRGPNFFAQFRFEVGNAHVQQIPDSATSMGTLNYANRMLMERPGLNFFVVSGSASSLITIWAYVWHVPRRNAAQSDRCPNTNTWWASRWLCCSGWTSISKISPKQVFIFIFASIFHGEQLTLSIFVRRYIALFMIYDMGYLMEWK